MYLRQHHFFLLLLLCALPTPAYPEASSGWSVAGKLRLRSEYLTDSFRLVAPISDHIQLARLELAARYVSPEWIVDLEVQDSRAWGAKLLSPIGADDVNTLEPVNLKLSRRWRWEHERALEVSAGRMTLDYGSRRLLARNQFRNTSNAFQGLSAQYIARESATQLFYFYPLQRQPDVLDARALRDNGFRLDKAGRGERFWGLTHDYRRMGNSRTVSGYMFGSEVQDQGRRLVADRQLTTLGSRATWRYQRLDFEAEGAYQWGHSVAGVLDDPADMLDHQAWFTHLHMGVDIHPSLNLRLSYDQATGDRDPLDGTNERFDRLYGARAFELGPSGIFGAAIRSNLRAPALRLRWQSTARQTWLLSHRWLRLDSARDFLVSAGRRDASGASGRDIGSQWELRWRWRPSDSGFDLEVGGAVLNKGSYFSGGNSGGNSGTNSGTNSGDDASGAADSGAVLNPIAPHDTRYLFAQLSWTF